MNVTPVQNNNTQSFGMAYRMKGDTAKRMAKQFNTAIFPEAAQENFVNKVLKPLKELTTEVIADGEKVFVEHPVTKQKFEVLEHAPWQTRGSNAREIHYPLNKIVDGNIEYAPHIVYYSEPQHIGKPAWDANCIYDGLLRKHVMALEVAKDFDKIAVQKAQEAVAKTNMEAKIEQGASKLQDLFG